MEVFLPTSASSHKLLTQRHKTGRASFQIALPVFISAYAPRTLSCVLSCMPAAHFSVIFCALSYMPASYFPRNFPCIILHACCAFPHAAVRVLFCILLQCFSHCALSCDQFTEITFHFSCKACFVQINAEDLAVFQNRMKFLFKFFVGRLISNLK